MIEPNEFDRILGAIRSWGFRSEARGGTEPLGAAPVESERPAPHAILLVDDDDETRLTVLEVLEAAGHTVLEARDGNEALMVIDWYDGPIDLVITDVVMPYVDGNELARRLQRLRHGTRVLYISGHFGQAPAEPGPAGVSHVLYKPFTPEELERTVRALLGTRRETRDDVG